MNVLFVLARYPGYGGIEKVSTILCNSLCDTLNWVGLYSFEQEYEEELLIELNDKVHYLKSVDSHRHYSAKNKIQLSELICDSHIDIVIYQDSYSHHFKTVASAIKKTKAKLIVVEHNTPEHSLWTTPIKDVINQNIKNNILWSILAYFKGRYFQYSQHIYKYIKCDKYILLSKRFDYSFKKIVPFASSKKLFSINNPNYIYPIQDIPAKNNICLFCGKLEPQKGLDLLFDVWTIIEKNRKDWQLVIVGDGSEYSKIQDIIEERNLTNVQLEGYQQNTTKYYSPAQIFLMTSRYEGWGMTLVEAKAHGCIPVLFNSYASASEVVNNNKDGLLIPPFDVNQYAESVLSLMDDNNRMKVLAQNGINDVKRFDIDIIREQWMNLFNSLIEKTK